MLYGFGAALAVLVVWTLAGKVQDAWRNVSAANVRANEAFLAVQGLRADVNNFQRVGNGMVLKDLGARLDRVEEQLAADRLEMLDVSERIAHKLQDRSRKRSAKDEVGDDGEEHDSYGARLARARAAYPLDPRQASFNGLEP